MIHDDKSAQKFLKISDFYSPLTIRNDYTVAKRNQSHIIKGIHTDFFQVMLQYYVEIPTGWTKMGWHQEGLH